jgi:hypothetical protein
MTHWIDRVSFGLQLRDAAGAEDPLGTLNDLLHPIIVGDGVEMDEADQDLIVASAQQIELAGTDASHRTALASEIGGLLVSTLPSSDALTLLRILVDRQRVAEVTAKHLNGLVSRTAWLGFVSEQAWAEELRSKVAAFGEETLAEFGRALNARDWTALQRLISE